MSMRFNITITEDDTDLGPLYQRLAALPQGHGRQHRARLVRQVLALGVAMQ